MKIFHIQFSSFCREAQTSLKVLGQCICHRNFEVKGKLNKGIIDSTKYRRNTLLLTVLWSVRSQERLVKRNPNVILKTLAQEATLTEGEHVCIIINWGLEVQHFTSVSFKFSNRLPYLVTNKTGRNIDTYKSLNWNYYINSKVLLKQK